MLDSPIEEIKNKLSITEVLGDYIQMKKAGTNLKAVCPFHSEKTPSLMVSPGKQIWHCFGCGLGGDIFEFVKLAENVDFAQALKILADRAGVELKKPTEQEIKLSQKKDVLYEINELAARYFAKVLWESEAGKEALDYLRNRGLTQATIKKWRLGFAPNDFHYLENFLSKKFSKKDIETSGLIVKKDNTNDYFDRFRDRVMFPIHNMHGQVVGFTGRLLHDKPNTGKYVNSPETPIYNKSRELYGLSFAKNHIRKENRCLLVEGNMDVISAHQVGTEITVASSGTALTEAQLNIIKRFTDNLVFAFDTDAAGLSATRRALEQALNLGFNVKIVRMQNAKDPDELIKKGIGIWQKALDTAPNFLEFFFDSTLSRMDPDVVENKREITKELVPLIVRIADPVTRAHFVRKLSVGINVAENAIWETVNKIQAPKPAKPKTEFSPKRSRREILEDKLLGLALLEGNKEELNGLSAEDFSSVNRAIFDSLQKGETPKRHDRLELLEFAVKTELQEQGLDQRSELKHTASEFKKIVFRQKMEQVSSELSQAEKSSNKQLVQELSKKFTELSSQISSLSS